MDLLYTPYADSVLISTLWTGNYMVRIHAVLVDTISHPLHLFIFAPMGSASHILANPRGSVLRTQCPNILIEKKALVRHTMSDGEGIFQHCPVNRSLSSFCVYAMTISSQQHHHAALEKIQGEHGWSYFWCSPGQAHLLLFSTIL